MIDTDSPSPKWGSSTKLLVGLTAIVLIGLSVWRFTFLMVPLTVAVMLAYLLHPIITFIVRRLRWPRSLVTGLLYLLLLLLVLSLATGLGIYLITQIASFNVNLQQIIVDLPQRINALTHSQYQIWGFTLDLNRFDLSGLYQRIADAIQPALEQAGSLIGNAASSTAEFLGWVLFVLLISFYLANEMPSLPGIVEGFAAGPGYGHDVKRLMHDTQRIWDAFLRGQLILALTVGIVNGVGLFILNVNYALILGMMSGFLIFIPYVGPLVTALVAAGIALFQAGNWFGIQPVPYAITVLVWFAITQQMADYVLSPRIIGEHLELHPAIILVGAIMGASLGGFVGLLLAAPVLATLKLFGRYAWHKLLDLPPFPVEPEVQPKGHRGFDLPTRLARLLHRTAAPAKRD
jgi:predicted PurR-regulated permease PerM